MHPRLAALRSSVRTLLGDWAGDRDEAPPPLPAGLPPAVAAVAASAVPMLIDYQGIGHARLYLQRLRRFIARSGYDEARLARIAELMAQRMAPEDAIRIAQLVLNSPDPAGSARHCRFTVSEMMSVLPIDLAAPLVNWFGWKSRTTRSVTRHFSAANPFSRARLRVEAGLRRWRSLSVAYARERLWVERWLHMIDRASVKQPEAMDAVIETATMMRGYGEAYRQGLADWHLIIDGLAKPAFDGTIILPDLAGAIEAARAAALPDPRQTSLKRTIAALRSGSG